MEPNEDRSRAFRAYQLPTSCHVSGEESATCITTSFESAEFAATAGDDYELLFTVPPDRRDAIERVAATTGTRVTWLGDVRPGGGLVEIRAPGGALVDLSGYEHL